MLYYNKHSAYLFKRKCLNWLTVEVLYGIWLLLVQASLTWHFKPKRWREFHHVHCKLKKNPLEVEKVQSTLYWIKLYSEWFGILTLAYNLTFFFLSN